MSKRAEELAKQLYPEPKLENYDDILVYRADRDSASMGMANVVCVYEQAEKDMLDKVCKWLEENVTYTHPRKEIKTCIINLNALREAMEE